LSAETVNNKGILGRIFRQGSKHEGSKSQEGSTSGSSAARASGCCSASKSPQKPSSRHSKCCDIRIIDLDEEENATDPTNR